MAASQKTVLSNSSRNSPEAYKQHANAPYMAHSKNTYRHVPGHPHQGQMPIQQPHYGQMMPGGMPYPGPMGPHPQFYPMGTPNPNYGPVYNHGPDQLSYYYYPHPSWPVPGAIAVYPQTGYANSPPPTPPHSGVPYGYQMAPGPEFYGTQLLPPTPPHANNYHGSSQALAANPVPQLEQRRSSWSSSAASESPTTPFMASAQTDTGPIIVEETHAMVASHSGSNDVVYGQTATHEKKSVEALLLAGPPLPTPIPALFSPESAKNVNQALDNPTHTTNVYIRGLPPDTDDDKLYEMTCRFGTVVSHKAIMDTDHGTCKGYGFARYENVDEAEDCIRGLVSSKYEAGFARESFNARLKTLADPNSTNVYVSNLPRSMNEKTMQDIFSGYTVVSNRILRDPEGNSRGVGFARFEDRSICDEIIRNFHGKLVGEEQIPLQVRYADTSAQKRLKATTTKKRQFRSNEYNSVVNSCYPSIPHHNVQPNNRVWPTSGPGNTLTFPVIPQSGSGKPEDWETPHWRPSTAIDQLETVRENGDDGDSESKTETNETNSPIVFDSITGSLGKTSSGSFSDPGDSYGGLEVSHGTHSF